MTNIISYNITQIYQNCMNSIWVFLFIKNGALRAMPSSIKVIGIGTIGMQTIAVVHYY